MSAHRQAHVVFVGPDKTGSTWIYERAKELPRVSTTRSKDLFFFDRFHRRGLDWYFDQFDERREAAATLEVGHDYVFSREALGRLAGSLPHTTVVLGLREPVERTVSAYRFLRSQGRIDLPIDRAVFEVPELIDHGRYGSLLTSIQGFFPPDAIRYFVFDDLADDPDSALAALASWCDVPTPPPSAQAAARVNGARTARHPNAVRIARAAGDLTRRLRLGTLAQKAKDSELVQRVFFEHDAEPPPRLSPSTAATLREIFTPEVQRLDALSGLQFAPRWGYETAPTAEPGVRPASRRRTPARISSLRG